MRKKKRDGYSSQTKTVGDRQERKRTDFDHEREAEEANVGRRSKIDAAMERDSRQTERAREKRLADLYARQHKLVAIGKKTQNNEAAELAAEEARNKRHRDAEAKRRDDKEKAAIAKKERMKREMMASIDNAIIRKREEQEALMKKIENLESKMNKIASAKLKLQDEEVKKTEEQENISARFNSSN